MDPAELALDPDELRRLDECAKEPIRTPGSIQAHGTLLGIDRTGLIAVASENASGWLGHLVAELGNVELEYAVRSGQAIDRCGSPGRARRATRSCTTGMP